MIGYQDDALGNLAHIPDANRRFPRWLAVTFQDKTTFFVFILHSYPKFGKQLDIAVKRTRADAELFF